MKMMLTNNFDGRDWVDEGEDALVHFSCEAVDQGNFLILPFKIVAAGQDSMKGTQRIGWDPIVNRFRASSYLSLKLENLL